MFKAIATGIKVAVGVYAGLFAFKTIDTLVKRVVSGGDKEEKKTEDPFPDFDINTYIKAAAEAAKRKEQTNG